MSAKIYNKMAAQIQSGSSYEDNAMFLLPFTSGQLNQNIDPLKDDSILGNGFEDLPQKGPQHTGGPVPMNVDVVSIAPILEAVFGNVSSGAYTFGSTNTKKLSLCALNSVNAVKYANAYPKTFKISGSSNGLLKAEVEFFSVNAQVREAITNFPASPTPPDEPFTFHEAGGTGYVRVGDSADALSSSDNIQIEDFNFDITAGFDEQFCNEGIRTLAPEFGMVPLSITGSFKLARFNSAAFLTWEENQTPLQMELLFAKSSSKGIKIQIPRFIIADELTDDDLTRQQITMHVARNGVGTSYKNTNMAFTSPIKITLINS